jgi:DHA1 family bicyclomycin/chloramphenicol resistance-like MFS transporter
LLSAHASWAMWPIALFAMGWALMTPVVTLLVLDVVPTRRGMASSLQACITGAVNGVVAGVVAPLVMHSTTALALTSALMMAVGLLAWCWVRLRL